MVVDGFVFNVAKEEDRPSSSLSAASLALDLSFESSPLASRRARRERSMSARDIRVGEQLERPDAAERRDRRCAPLSPSSKGEEERGGRKQQKGRPLDVPRGRGARCGEAAGAAPPREARLERRGCSDDGSRTAAPAARLCLLFLSFFLRPFDVRFRVSAQAADDHPAAQALARPLGGSALCRRGSTGVGRPDLRARGGGSRWRRTR